MFIYLLVKMHQTSINLSKTDTNRPISTRLTGVVLSNPEPDRVKTNLNNGISLHSNKPFRYTTYSTLTILQVNKSSKIHPIKAFALFREYSLRNP